MRLFLILVLLMGFGTGFASTGARADGYAPQAYKPHRHHAQRIVHHRHRHHVAILPGVLGMERAGVLYWRPAVEPMPEFLFDEAEPAYGYGRHTVSARY